MTLSRVFRIALFVVTLISVFLIFVERPFAQPTVDIPEGDDGSYDAVEDPDAPEDAKDVVLQDTDKNKKIKKTIIRSIRRSDSLMGILHEHGINTDQVYDLLALPTWPKHFVLVPGSRYLVSEYTQKERVELIFFIPRSVQVIQISKEGPETEMRLTDISLDVRVKQVSGEISGSLFSSLRRVASDPWVAMRFLDAYSLDYKLEKQVRKGAKFSVTYEEKVMNGQVVAPGEVLYTSIEVDGRKDERHFLRANQGGVFLGFNSDHDLRPFFSPIEYFHISSPFNPRRFHPVRRRRMAHKGVDLALPHGSNVMAALDGVVKRVGRNKAAGQFVVLSHLNGYDTEYVHLSEIEKYIVIGAKVDAGQKLGQVGCTGYCTRPHLHFGIAKDGEHFDPVRYVKPYTQRQETQVNSLYDCLSKKETADACFSKTSAGATSGSDQSGLK